MLTRRIVLSAYIDSLNSYDLLEDKMTLFVRVTLLLLLIALGNTALAQTRQLSADEIKEVFSGSTAVGLHLEKNKKFKMQVKENGQLLMIYGYDRSRPYRIKGTWSAEDNNWCRTLFVENEKRHKCQNIIEEESAYYFVDLDGTRTSRCFKSDIIK